MRALAQDDLDQRRGVAANLAGLPPEALRRPVGVTPVARRHVLAQPCRAACAAAPAPMAVS